MCLKMRFVVDWKFFALRYTHVTFLKVWSPTSQRDFIEFGHDACIQLACLSKLFVCTQWLSCRLMA